MNFGRDGLGMYRRFFASGLDFFSSARLRSTDVALFVIVLSVPGVTAGAYKSENCSKFLSRKKKFVFYQTK